MVEHLVLEQLPAAYRVLRHLNVRLAKFRVAGEVVVHQEAPGVYPQNYQTFNIPIEVRMGYHMLRPGIRRFFGSVAKLHTRWRGALPQAMNPDLLWAKDRGCRPSFARNVPLSGLIRFDLAVSILGWPGRCRLAG